MIWRFTIYDRNNVATVIDEPVGWDAAVSEIKRDLDWHGIFFSNTGDTFQFDGIAMKLLKNEYEQYGVEGNMALGMEEDCGNGFEEFNRGNFDFGKYEFVCGEECYVKIPVEKAGSTIELRNRLNQKVNLETTKAFDETTILPAYSKLPFEMELPSKGILLKNIFEQTEDFTTPVLGVPFNDNPGGTSNSEFGMIEIGMDKQTSAEIGNAGTELQPKYNCVLTNQGSFGCNSLNKFQFPFPLTNFVAPLDITACVNYQEGTPNYGQVSDVVKLDINIKGVLGSVNCQFQSFYFVIATLPKDKTGENDSDYIYHKRQLINPTSILQPIGSAIDISQTYTNPNFILNKGDRLYVYYAIYHVRQNIYAGTNAFNMTFDKGSYIKMETLSRTPATISKVFAVNEAISRVAEVITNDNLRAYSEYFGRTDSQPYSHAADGCGSLEVLTDGLRIRRQENKIPNKTSLFTLSLQDAFEGLNPIHNIGMGIEPDPNRAGYDRLRVESWKHFYNDSVIMSCTDVGKITRKVYEKEIFSTFQFGYQKWEAEEYTGLDEFLTKRTSRTTLSQVKNDLVKLSKFIYSGYAIEITRRKGDNNSKDWRYDKETFGICVSRTKLYHVNFYAAGNKMIFETTTNGNEFLVGSITISGTTSNDGVRNVFVTSLSSAGGVTTVEISFSGGVTINEESFTVTFPGIASPGGLFVELGNVINPQNIIDPNTLYNYRRSPIRNAMRWMNKVLASYRQFDNDAKVIFTDGDGNYYAEGQMKDPNCRLESGVVAENRTIDLNIYADPDDAKPFLTPERVVYEYPMSSKDYKSLKTNPYGKIYFSNDCEEGYGWIDTVTYKHEAGLAQFNLIPSHEIVVPVECDGFQINDDCIIINGQLLKIN